MRTAQKAKPKVSKPTPIKTQPKIQQSPTHRTTRPKIRPQKKITVKASEITLLDELESIPLFEEQAVGSANRASEEQHRFDMLLKPKLKRLVNQI
ncbi:MAG: hypothetical protein ACXAD7_06620 [Candidatus Kariarchaeaceae archaeon]